MMNIICSIVLVISIFCINDISAIPGFDRYFTLNGQVIYPFGSRVSIPSDSQLIIELQDISVTHGLVKTIAQHTSRAIVFPIIFNIRYAFDQIIHSHVHVLNAKIINKDHEIIFANQNRIQVKLLGIGRTTFIDIPVLPYSIEHDDSAPSIKLLEWPKLIGMDGDQAVDIIKQQTGYKNVFIVTDESQITKDLRYDRVCVYVDADNKVALVPRTG